MLRHRSRSRDRGDDRARGDGPRLAEGGRRDDRPGWNSRDVLGERAPLPAGPPRRPPHLTGANADVVVRDGARAGSGADADGGGGGGGAGDAAGAPLEKANFGLSGALARDAGMESKKWSPPIDARVPDKKWRLYVFKGASPDPISTLHLHRQSAVLIGRDAAAVEIVTDHASTSKQHAALVFRSVRAPAEPGDMGPPVFLIKPYLIDLESTNGTTLNGERVEAARYIELRVSDTLRFGQSSREYVLMCEE